jgi:cytochrome c oxidase cbb3-type subunit 3
LATFYGAVIFGILYVGYYEFGPGPGSREELAEDLGKLKQQEILAKGSEPPVTEESMLAIFHSKERLAAGHKLFTEKCMACHGPDGGGQIGPNLTDAFWIHGKGTLTDIVTVVSEGVADKGMPPWGTMLKKDEIYSVVAYVKSLKGTHPANPKASQGIEIKD